MAEPTTKGNIPRVLIVAGSDSGGGAGIQADLKAVAALGGFGMTAVTAVTVQNTLGVFGAHEIPSADVAAQMRVVLEDLGVDVVKTGMLGGAATVKAVAEMLRAHPVPQVVVDPVMVAKSGDHLLHPDAREALVKELLPLATLVTPNVPEGEVLSGLSINSEESLRAAGLRIHKLGPRHVLMKGGHLPGRNAQDWLFDGADWHSFSTPRIETRNTHGTGCTFASAIATLLGKGQSMQQAVAEAKEYLTGAIRYGLPFGAGHGPLDHGWQGR